MEYFTSLTSQMSEVLHEQSQGCQKHETLMSYNDLSQYMSYVNIMIHCDIINYLKNLLWKNNSLHECKHIKIYNHNTAHRLKTLPLIGLICKDMKDTTIWQIYILNTLMNPSSLHAHFFLIAEPELESPFKWHNVHWLFINDNRITRTTTKITP